MPAFRAHEQLDIGTLYDHLIRSSGILVRYLSHRKLPVRGRSLKYIRHQLRYDLLVKLTLNVGQQLRRFIVGEGRKHLIEGVVGFDSIRKAYAHRYRQPVQQGVVVARDRRRGRGVACDLTLKGEIATADML